MKDSLKGTKPLGVESVKTNTEGQDASKGTEKGRSILQDIEMINKPLVVLGKDWHFGSRRVIIVQHIWIGRDGKKLRDLAFPRSYD